MNNCMYLFCDTIPEGTWTLKIGNWWQTKIRHHPNPTWWADEFCWEDLQEYDKYDWEEEK